MDIQIKRNSLILWVLVLFYNLIAEIKSILRLILIKFKLIKLGRKIN